MNTRVITDPSALGWEQDGATANGTPIYKWADGADNEHPIVDGDTEGQVTTWDGAKWTPDSSLTISSSGDATFTGDLYLREAGTGTEDRPMVRVNIPSSTFGGSLFHSSATDSWYEQNAVCLFNFDDGPLSFGTNNNTRLTIDATGNATFSGDVLSSANGGSAYLTANTGSVAGNAGVYLSRQSVGTQNFISCLNGGSQVFAVSPTGMVDAAGFTVNGSPIGGGGADPLRLKTGGIGIANNDAALSGTFSTEPVIEIESAPMYGNNQRHTGVLISCALPGGWGTQEVYFNLGDNWQSYNATPALTIRQSGLTAADFIATSDERVKDNITTAPVGLIDSLKGREWDWKESGEKGSGVVAQELEEVLPHLVHTDDDGMKSVAYNGLVAYLIEEVKALKAEVEALK